MTSPTHSDERIQVILRRYAEQQQATLRPCNYALLRNCATIHNAVSLIGQTALSIIIKNIPLHVACHVNILLLLFDAISLVMGLPACHIQYQQVVLLFGSPTSDTLHLSLLPFFIHYYCLVFTTTLQLSQLSSMLPFINPYYPLTFTATL